MEDIKLQDVVPEIFAGEPAWKPAVPGVWKQPVSLRKGEFYLIEAASGAGKSSLCSFLYGLRKDYIGRILYDGVNVSTYGISQWVEVRRRHIAYLQQGMGIFPELTVYENIQLKNRMTRYKTKSQIEAMAKALGIAHKLNSPARLLSIGQQQRVALVRTLCQPADFFLLDEPVSHLDTQNNQAAAELVVSEAKSQGAGIIVTSVGNDLMLGDIHHITL